MKRVPIGIEDFRDIIERHLYYVDKTLLIKNLLGNKGEAPSAEVTLFTRPRRFGKTLNMSMLRYFFDCKVSDQRELFAGLKIMDAGEQYLAHMGQYPVISVSLKEVRGRNFDSAFAQLCGTLQMALHEHNELLDDTQARDDNKEKLRQLLDRKPEPAFLMQYFSILSQCLYEHHGKKAVILIDEYDVPLEEAWTNGYYDKMVDCIRSLMGYAFKTNKYMEFAVITGCLRIAKESIFTGLNHLDMVSIMNSGYSEFFGFTQEEVDEALRYYGLEDEAKTVQEWYNGYLFGKTDVYNPWSVVKYLKSKLEDRDALPQPYWANTSGNSIVRTLIDNSQGPQQEEIETLLAGGTIDIPIHEDIVYGDVSAQLARQEQDTEQEQNHDQVWNFLFFTGYLKRVGEPYPTGDGLSAKLKIPNREIRYIYRDKIQEWIRATIFRPRHNALYKAIMEGDAETITSEVSAALLQTISYMDYNEDFYHGFMLGLLQAIPNVRIRSNREAGTGRYDMALYSWKGPRFACIMEFKLAASFKTMDAACDAGIKQIIDNDYTAELLDDGYPTVLRYGLAFYKKNCLARLG
jgi:hypothetical protein